MQVKIVDFEPVTVAVLEHRGDPALLNGSVQRFIVWRKESGLSPTVICAPAFTWWHGLPSQVSARTSRRPQGSKRDPMRRTYEPSENRDLQTMSAN